MPDKKRGGRKGKGSQGGKGNQGGKSKKTKKGNKGTVKNALENSPAPGDKGSINPSGTKVRSRQEK